MLRHAGGRQAAARAAFVTTYDLPADVRRRFGEDQPEVDAAGRVAVEAAARQWFRLLARDPGGNWALPSTAVSDLWEAMTRRRADYAAFCAGAFGRPLQHAPPPAGEGEAAGGLEGLARTLVAASKDEPYAPDGVPLLFRVDAATGVLNGRRYLATCGGGAECYPVPGLLCLRHLSGRARPERRTYDPRRDKPYFEQGAGPDRHPREQPGWPGGGG